MEEQKIMRHLLDAMPYPILYVDCDHVIRYLNKAALFHYYQVRGYKELIGKSLFDCHQGISKEKIVSMVEKLKHHGNELFIGVEVNNQRIYLAPVRDDEGVLIGYFERFELNQRL